MKTAMGSALRLVPLLALGALMTGCGSAQEARSATFQRLPIQTSTPMDGVLLLPHPEGPHQIGTALYHWTLGEPEELTPSRRAASGSDSAAGEHEASI